MPLEETGVSFVAEDSDSFITAFDDAGDAAGTFESAVSSAGAGIDVAGEIMTGALRAVGEAAFELAVSAGGALIGFFSDSFSGALEAETTMARLTAQIEAQGPAAAVTAEQAMALADEYAHLAGGSDDAVIAAEAVLLKFNAIGSETFPTAIEQSANLAALMGTDLSSAAQLLGLALDDPTSSLTRLDKATGAFTEAEKLQIAAMAESGDVAGAQALILANLEEAIGGTAETLALTTAGQWTIFQETIADTGEAIASSLLGPLNILMTTYLMPLIPVIQEVGTAFGLFFESLLSGDVGGAFDVLGEFDSTRAILQGLGIDVYALGGFFQDIYDFVIANIPLMQETFETVFTAIGEVFTVLSDFINVTLMPAIASIWEQTGLELPTAQQTFEAVMAAIVTATQLVSDFITDILVPTLTETVDWVVANWPAIQATIEEVWAAVEAITTTVITAVQAIITTVMTAVLAFWASNGAAIVADSTATWNTIQATISTIITTVQAVITTVLTAIQEFWNAHGESIMTIVNFMMATVMTNIENGTAFIQGVITTVLAAIQIFWDTWGTTIIAIVTNMVESTGAVIDAFAAILEGDWDALGTALETIWDNAWENIGMIIETAAESIGTIISDMVTSIGVEAINFANDLVSTFLNLGADLADGWMDTWVAIGHIVGTGVNSILSIDWASVGTNIINSIGTGISNAAGNLAQQAADAAYAAYLAMLEALGMGSPSRLFLEAGENTQESMEMGIDRRADLVALATRDSARNAARALMDSMDVVRRASGMMTDVIVSPIASAQQLASSVRNITNTDARSINYSPIYQRGPDNPVQSIQTLAVMNGIRL